MPVKKTKKVVIPSHLAKALVDPFDYSMGLTTGEIIRFNMASINKKCPDWVHLSDARYDDGREDLGRKFERGIDVRISEIVWVTDAPYGS